MAKIGSAGRQSANAPRRNFAAFTGGEEYSPQVADEELDQTESQAGDADETTKKTDPPADSKPPAASSKPPASKPVRKNWTFSPEFVNELLASKANWAHAAMDEGRHIRYSNLAEQAWIAALATWAMEQLVEDLKQGPSHGLAGEIHKYFPENSRAVRGYH